MNQNNKIYSSINELSDNIFAICEKLAAASSDGRHLSGVAGFDGFIDTFIHMESPSTMVDFGPKVAAAAGIAASFPVHHQGDKFGGNGPLIASALHDIHGGDIDINYIGAMGRDAILPIFQEALAEKMRLHSLADPAHSDCLEFEDGKIMLSDMRSCSEITWKRLLECLGEEELDSLLQDANFVAAVNWGKLPHVDEIWRNLAKKLEALGAPAKSIPFFMDLAEFEHRGEADIQRLLDETLPIVTRQCHSILSSNLKEAWQMGTFLGVDYSGKKDAKSVAELAAFLRSRIDVDRIVIHPNDGAACASAEGTVYVPGPVCSKPLISTGAGDNFGGGCLSGALLGLDDIGILMCGVATSGWFVRSGMTPTFRQIAQLLENWLNGDLPERLV